jgi:conjugal transfer pilus assembly protein TraV
VVVPPQVMRVLILPYTGDERELYMYRYVYMFVDEPRWLLKNPLSESGEAEK